MKRFKPKIDNIQILCIKLYGSLYVTAHNYKSVLLCIYAKY